MKKNFLQSMAWLHTWFGLIFGWLLFSILLSGAITVFYAEINVWATPELDAKPDTDHTQSVRVGVEYLQKVAPEARLWRLILPSAREPILRVAFTDTAGKLQTHRLDPATGQVVTRDVRGGMFFFHYHRELLLDYEENPLGLYLVAIAGIVMIVACISGIVIHKRIFKDFFTFRPRASKQRAWLDVHNVVSVLPLPFHIMMAYTGLVLLYWLYVPAAVQTLYGGDRPLFRREALGTEYQDTSVVPGAPAPLADVLPLVERAEKYLGTGTTAAVYFRDPNRANAITEIWRTRTDRVHQQVSKVTFDGATGEELRVRTEIPTAVAVQSTTAALHFVEWGGPMIRWVYFFSGLAGAASVGTGLVLFTLKREKKSAADPAFYRLVHALNIAAVTGFAIACAAFFWAERLLPLDLATRNTRITQIFFGAWLLALLHAAAIKPYTAWIHQITLCALLCLALPLTGVVVHRDLIRALGASDWLRAGVDLTSAGIGVVLLGVAAHLIRRNPSSKHALGIAPEKAA